MILLNEDDIYRSSTQYKFWSFSLDSLSSLRNTTNTLAANGVREAVLQQKQKSAGTGNIGDVTIDCLTVEEEQKLVGFYCVKAMQLADFCDFPTNVKVGLIPTCPFPYQIADVSRAAQATAVQYLKRFYLSNSPMTYHPKEIMRSAVFLSTKTENHYTSLRSFVAKLPKTTADDILAPEFLLTQGLRFTFDVRHPHRALEGGFMDCLAIARGQRGELLKNTMMRIGSSEHWKKGVAKDTDQLVARIQSAHGRAKDTLKTSALLTDVYFHYTPSQIWLSAFLLADQPLTEFFVESALPANSDLKQRLVNALKGCAEMLSASLSADPGDAEMKELMEIDKKLYKCRNPDKMDLVSMNKAAKREGGQEGELDGKVIKKRKLEREQKADDVFGPPI